eukprot:516398_1
MSVQTKSAQDIANGVDNDLVRKLLIQHNVSGSSLVADLSLGFVSDSDCDFETRAALLMEFMDQIVVERASSLSVHHSATDLRKTLDALKILPRSSSDLKLLQFMFRHATNDLFP